jgi:hypothetical protein
VEEEQRTVRREEFDMWCLNIKEETIGWIDGDRDKCPSCVIREMLESFGLTVEK